MKQIFLLILLVCCLSCSFDKELKLPEIQHSKIVDILDVSPAYVFYNTNEKDSVELNKQNLISTTNWLVNVDKRLSLRQAIPVLIELQNKKRDASHKKEGVKNYFTAFNPEHKSLCFIEFTNVNYHLKTNAEDYIKDLEEQPEVLNIDKNGVQFKSKNYTIDAFVKHLKSTSDERHKFVLNLDNQLTVQDYMHIKDLLLTISDGSVLINTNEFIFQS
ncbi:conserved hypothetical protein [Formosa agariphila KMM 3901]|uniref:Uncharacterized protein n=1 Tax=Formosa agariphila (strain DSM 15362 / KCTC 12365 / LMG 23005 / KMM 3901 / M-2Alg 35-1) TaxID=1347342 RepID=T2KPP5_FORAG|nr:hypothetical protein [Formosa agariphila]CDF80426.1 conserved hypothetical protein [Formosa agariphila KMM 3901]